MGLSSPALRDASGDGEPESDGTALDPDETQGLIPGHIQTQPQLNEWEALNIAKASAWAARRKGQNWLSTHALRELHRRMFDETWKWAGRYRTSDKNISPYRWTQVPELMENLVANARARFQSGDQSPVALDDIAMRFHYELVHIHPWPNGNGRHARLATDLLLRSWNRPPFTWGSALDASDAELRKRHIDALRRADAGDYSLLRRFVRA